ncbi:MAG: hypothetical protein M1829_003301 [Trizodia sp. TS-e1964]|nr:MAG: hypothetical protein M1829_003301 [Trizodia sp. TS-e1964]
MSSQPGGQASASFSPSSRLYPPSPLHPRLQASYRPLDEGYSEDTRSQAESEDFAMHNSASDVALPDWLKAMSESDRTEFAISIIGELRTSSIVHIIERIKHRLHIDPLVVLPPELTFQVFSHLSPSALVKAASLSQSWRDRALDTRLWKKMYLDNGWKIDERYVHTFDDMISRICSMDRPTSTRRIRRRRVEFESNLHHQRLKRRLPENGGIKPNISFLTKDDSNHFDGAFEWKDQHGKIETDEADPLEDTENVDMPDADEPLPEESFASRRPDFSPGNRALPILDTYSSAARALDTLERANNPVGDGQLTLLEKPQNGPPVLNWRYLYKQRLRLEENWNKGAFINFQLPHPDFPEEAHRECIYTIQYSALHLVSGSRDRTVRVWDLDRRRLIRTLVGHQASVLCLQFDESPEEDVIISGSSDTAVIVWQFSTGQLIKRIENAHRESVLNLRFDKKHLVTCSKDKTIRVWSRKSLRPTDRDYPLPQNLAQSVGAVLPQYIIDLEEYNLLAKCHRLPDPWTRESSSLPPYSLLITLEGHGAAVNAIQVLGDRIVSASGDRSVKIWEISTGMCLKTLPGHIKGIACVQFDGRRVVSGSSDNTVRIFDEVSGAEVAVLVGHNHLVRTVQAGFADQPWSIQDDLKKAREVDKKFFAAGDAGEIPGPSERTRRRIRNAGSNKPKDITTYGAALPPGGGGSIYGRVVSGSYDETVIIWKRDAEGNWVVGHKLKQEDAARAAGGPAKPSAAIPSAGHVSASSGSVATTQQDNVAQTPNLYFPPPPLDQGPSAVVHLSSLQSLPIALRNIYISLPPPHQAAISQMLIPQQIALLNNLAQIPDPAETSILQQYMNTTAHLAAQNSLATAANPPMQQGYTHIQPAPVQQHVNMNNAPLGNGDQASVLAQSLQTQFQANQTALAATAVGNHRVFKIQFDARRIICCSVDPRIVGWDFANGDPELEQASKFFRGLD